MMNEGMFAIALPMVLASPTYSPPRFGLSTIVVVGGAGDYFDVADTVLLLDNYTVVDVTERAKQIAAQHPANIPHLEPIVSWTNPGP